MKTNLRRFYLSLLLLCLFYNAKAQLDVNQKITVNFREQALAEVLASLKKNYQIKFTYSNEQVALQTKITCIARQQTLKSVLDKICGQAGLRWQMVSGHIVLRTQKAVNAGEKQSDLFQTVRGKVVDKDSKVPLAGVGIKIISGDTEKTTLSSVDGYFRIEKVPIGRHELVCSYLGFEPLVIPQLLLSSAKEMVLNIEMTEAMNALGTVTVSGFTDRQAPLNEMAMISARSFTVEETSRYAAGNFDPARMAQNLAGVTITDDISNEIVIRGNSPKGLLWRLEGIEINNPNHFGEEGSSGGGVSMISANVLANSDFYTGAFPAEYGNALSGVFDLQFRKGNTEKKEYAFMVGILGTEFSFEGPFSKKSSASYLVNYRYSTLALLEQIGINPAGDNPTPKYQDLAFNLYFPASRAGSFSLFGIMGYSYQNGIAQKDSLTWDSYQDKFNRKNSYSSASVGLKNLKTLNNRAYVKNIIALSWSDIRDNSDTLDYDYQPNVYARDRFLNYTIRYSGMLNYKSNTANTLRTGLTASFINFDFNSTSYKSNLGKLSEYINTQGNACLLEGFGQWKHQFSANLHMNTGLHLSYFGLSNDVSAEPRLGLAYTFRKKNLINLAAGLHSRVEPIALYFGKNELEDGSYSSSNGDLKLTKSAHFIAGYQYSFNKDTKLKIETYYQHLFDVPVTLGHNFSALNTSDAYFIYSRNYGNLVNEGKGRNYGVELTLERMFSKSYYVLFTSSLYKAEFSNSKGQYFLSTYSGNYSANLLFGKEIRLGNSGKNSFSFNGKVLLNGGRRYTPLNVAASVAEDYPVYHDERVNTLKAPAYSRIDISFNYRVSNPKASHVFYLDVQNVLNRLNTRELYYNSDKKDIDTLYYTGIIPTMNYKIEF